MKKNFNKLKNKTNLIAIVLVIVSIGILFCVQETKPKVVKAYNNYFISIPEEKNWAFTKKKIIIDSASYKEDDQNISFISSIMNDYNLIGSNTLYEGKDIANDLDNKVIVNYN